MPRRKWSAEIVISAIKRLRKQGKPLNPSYISKHYKSLETAAYSYCGSWKSAVEAAGIPYDSVVYWRRKPTNKKWSAEAVVSKIKELHKQGTPLNPGYVQEHYSTLETAARTYCGGWEKAVEAAGIPYSSVLTRTRRSKDSIVDRIKALAKDHPLNARSVEKIDPNLAKAARKYFGGWDEALKASGFDPSKIRLKPVARKWSKAAIVAEIKARSKAGKSNAWRVVNRENRSLYAAAHKHFGKKGWAKARVLAGLPPVDPHPSQKWNRKTVIAAIKQLHKEGTPLHVFNMTSHSHLYRIYSGAYKVFGTWGNALREAGLDYSKIRRLKPWGWWTKQRVITTIRSLERSGVRLNSKTIHSDYSDLFAGSIKEFGSWSQAVEAAGINYQVHTTRWSTKTWLRRMRPEEYMNLLDSTHRHAQTRRRKAR